MEILLEKFYQEQAKLEESELKQLWTKDNENKTFTQFYAENSIYAI